MLAANAASTHNDLAILFLIIHRKDNQFCAFYRIISKKFAIIHILIQKNIAGWLMPAMFVLMILL